MVRGPSPRAPLAEHAAGYEWQLSLHLLPSFAEHRLSEITIAEVDRYRQAKVREGRLSPTSINKTIRGWGRSSRSPSSVS